MFSVGTSRYRSTNHACHFSYPLHLPAGMEIAKIRSAETMLLSNLRILWQIEGCTGRDFQSPERRFAVKHCVPTEPQKENDNQEGPALTEGGGSETPILHVGRSTIPWRGATRGLRVQGTRYSILNRDLDTSHRRGDPKAISRRRASGALRLNRTPAQLLTQSMENR